jgi:hypothetical protein
LAPALRALMIYQASTFYDSQLKRHRARRPDR